MIPVEIIATKDYFIFNLSGDLFYYDECVRDNDEAKLLADEIIDSSKKYITAVLTDNNYKVRWHMIETQVPLNIAITLTKKPEEKQKIIELINSSNIAPTTQLLVEKYRRLNELIDKFRYTYMPVNKKRE